MKFKLPGGKTKTTVSTEVVKTTERKIVQLTYLQSLALTGGLDTAEKLAGTTDSSVTDFDSTDKKKNLVSGMIDKIQNGSAAINQAAGDAGPILNGLIKAGLSPVNGLFGKTTKTDVKGTIKDSGWSLVKTWAQPQFDIIRYALGIRELVVSQFTYVPTSEIISKPWLSPKEIQKVTLIVDQFIPPQFPAGTDYIQYFVKPDIDDAEWIRINAIDLPSQFTDAGDIVPRIITFNVERPISARLEESYIRTATPVKAVRFRAVLRRPADSDDSYSPILKSYRMLLTPANGL